MNEGAYLGLDIGGTGIKGLRLDPDGRIGARVSRPTPQGKGAEVILREVASVLQELSGGAKIASVGAGTPGAVDSRGVVVAEAVNIPGWKGTDLRAACEAASGAPATVRNDANLAAYAEWIVRQGQGRPPARNLLFVGLGTGIGGGYIEDGRILGGTDDRAVELGHVVIRPKGRLCACGRRGCVEAYAAGPSIAALARDIAQGLAPGQESPLSRLALGTEGKLTAREVYEAFAAGDSLALRVHAEVAEALAHAIGLALALLAPDTVVLGGGVLKGAQALVEDVARLVPDYVYTAAVRDCRFEPALLGAEAGLLGASLYGASLVLEREALVKLAAAASTRDAQSPQR